jgi:hypothetical protein
LVEDDTESDPWAESEGNETGAEVEDGLEPSVVEVGAEESEPAEDVVEVESSSQ